MVILRGAFFCPTLTGIVLTHADKFQHGMYSSHLNKKNNVATINVSLKLNYCTGFPTMWQCDKCRLRQICAASTHAKKLQMLFGK